MQTQTVLNKDFTVQLLRNLARVKCCFISFSTADGNHTNKPLTNEFYLPPTSLNHEGTDTRLEYFMTLGGKKITTFTSSAFGVIKSFQTYRVTDMTHSSARANGDEQTRVSMRAISTSTPRRSPRRSHRRPARREHESSGPQWWLGCPV